MEEYSFCLNIIIARHMARLYGENQALAITRAARRVRSATKDAKMYELSGQYAKELAPANNGASNSFTGAIAMETVQPLFVNQKQAAK